MTQYYPISSFDRSYAVLQPDLPDSARIERALARALDAVGQCAGLLWWDGSALGLSLNGVIGLIDPDEAERRSPRPEATR